MTTEVQANVKMNISNHFYERYVERIVGIADNTERKQYIVTNKDKLTEHISKLWEHAEFIWKGALYSNTTGNFYLRDNIVIVTDVQNTCLITLYRIDYGFKDELNRLIAQETLQDIARKRNELEIVETYIGHRVEELQIEGDDIQARIKHHESALASLRQRAKANEESIKAVRLQSDELRRDIEVDFHRICNSIEYKREVMGGKK
jgi:hypothetical protein